MVIPCLLSQKFNVKTIKCSTVVTILKLLYVVTMNLFHLRLGLVFIYRHRYSHCLWRINVNCYIYVHVNYIFSDFRLQSTDNDGCEKSKPAVRI